MGAEGQLELSTWWLKLLKKALKRVFFCTDLEKTCPA